MEDMSVKAQNCQGGSTLGVSSKILQIILLVKVEHALFCFWATESVLNMKSFASKLCPSFLNAEHLHSCFSELNTDKIHMFSYR